MFTACLSICPVTKVGVVYIAFNMKVGQSLLHRSVPTSQVSPYFTGQSLLYILICVHDTM